MIRVRLRWIGIILLGLMIRVILLIRSQRLVLRFMRIRVRLRWIGIILLVARLMAYDAFGEDSRNPNKSGQRLYAEFPDTLLYPFFYPKQTRPNC